MIKITEVVMVWFGGDLIFKTYIYVFCELGPVKKKRTYTYVVAKGLKICHTTESLWAVKEKIVSQVFGVGLARKT